MKKYKYKREHFSSQEEFERFKKGRTEAMKKWIRKRDSASTEFHERRILRQRIYSRYYWHSDGRQSFADWLLQKYGIEDIKKVSLEDLRVIGKKS